MVCSTSSCAREAPSPPDDPDKERRSRYCGTDTVQDGKWHHVAAVIGEERRFREILFFVDGKLQAHAGSNEDEPVDTATGPPMTLGNGLQGALDDLRVYDRALTVAEVKAVFGPRPCAQDADCEDGNACTEEFCSEGVCNTGSLSCHANSCEQLPAEMGVTTDGDYTLYLANDVQKAFTAHCVDMASLPRNNLTLVHTDDGCGQTHAQGENFANYEAGRFQLTAWYQKVRLNPVIPAIHFIDKSFFGKCLGRRVVRLFGPPAPTQECETRG